MMFAPSFPLDDPFSYCISFPKEIVIQALVCSPFPPEENDPTDVCQDPFCVQRLGAPRERPMTALLAAGT